MDNLITSENQITFENQMPIKESLSYQDIFFNGKRIGNLYERVPTNFLKKASSSYELFLPSNFKNINGFENHTDFGNHIMLRYETLADFIVAYNDYIRVLVGFIHTLDIDL